MDDSRRPSYVARELERLKHQAFSNAARRERLPQPLFWSLFFSKVKSIRTHKEQEDLLKGLFL
ncbi:hypothetical protein JNK13_03980 [bacterium]|nr:hypothetical protein [bacterium]